MQLEICQSVNLLEKLARKNDAGILFSENRVNPTDDKVNTWMTEEITSGIIQYVETGGDWLAWHSEL
ncbi:hypothetical protein ACTQ5K_11295 [Niallia sp. Sow4_A1]|uniref:hypothetical protein n=1 Tax=Niallia sp. Sow4_A1 TaxID=3438793 RepID=UPI003F9DD408